MPPVFADIIEDFLCRKPFGPRAVGAGTGLETAGGRAQDSWFGGTPGPPGLPEEFIFFVVKFEFFSRKRPGPGGQKKIPPGSPTSVVAFGRGRNDLLWEFSG